MSQELMGRSPGEGTGSPLQGKSWAKRHGSGVERAQSTECHEHLEREEKQGWLAEEASHRQS